MGKDTESRDLEPFDLDEDFGDSWDIDDDDFVDIDLDFGKAKTGPVPEEIFERPVRRVERVANDPYADHDRMEDVTSVRYQRKIEDEGRRTSGKKSGGHFGGGMTYVILGLVCLVVIAGIMLILKFASGGSGEKESDTTTKAPVETTAEAPAAVWEKDANADVTALIEQYYAALSAVDVSTLQTVLDASVAIDEARLNAEAQVIEAYQNISCYITDGKNSGEYAVYIAFAMKFKNIETAAPGLVPAYVKTDANGSLKLITWDVAQHDKELSAYIGTVANCDTIRDLAAQIDEEYKAAYNGDPTLAAFLNSLNGKVEESTEAPEETTAAPEETTAAPEETTAAPQPTTAASSEQTFEEVDTMRYTTAKVKARKAPNTNDSTDFTVVEKGTYLHMYGKSAEWGKVHLSDGTTGYIKLEYLSPYEPADDAE